MAATAAPKELNPDASILGPRAARLARGPDFSQLRPPIKTTVSGTRQVIHALETATGEVKKVLLDEINLMYECKICQSVFRSLANLISHKRTFCKTKYNQALHLYQDKEGTEAANMQTVLIEAEPVECVAEAQTSHDLSCYSPSLELLKTAGILEDLMARRRPCVGPGGHGSRLVAPGRQRLGAVVEGLKEKMDGAQHTMLGLKKNFEAPRPQSTMHLEVSPTHRPSVTLNSYSSQCSRPGLHSSRAGSTPMVARLWARPTAPGSRPRPRTVGSRWGPPARS
jgi:hypothetical protein